MPHNPKELCGCFFSGIKHTLVSHDCPQPSISVMVMSNGVFPHDRSCFPSRVLMFVFTTAHKL